MASFTHIGGETCRREPNGVWRDIRTGKKCPACTEPVEKSFFRRFIDALLDRW